MGGERLTIVSSLAAPSAPPRRRERATVSRQRLNENPQTPTFGWPWRTSLRNRGFGVGDYRQGRRHRRAGPSGRPAVGGGPARSISRRAMPAPRLRGLQLRRQVPTGPPQGRGGESGGIQSLRRRQLGGSADT